MYNKAYVRCRWVQTQLLFNRFNFFSHRQSCEFSALFLSFLFYLHAWPRKLPKQNNVFCKTTETVGSIIRFRNVNHTCRYTHAKIFSLSYVLYVRRQREWFWILLLWNYILSVRVSNRVRFCFHLKKKNHIFWSQGGTPLYKLCGYVPPHRVGFLRRFGLKIGIQSAQVIMLYHNTWIFPACGSLGHQDNHYHQTWAVLLEALSCQWEDRCLHAIHSRSYHSYSHNWGLCTCCSSRMRTYHCQVMLLPSMSS